MSLQEISAFDDGVSSMSYRVFAGRIGGLGATLLECS